MYKIAKIEIAGFRGQTKPIALNMSTDANFLIGRNGTGKTTLINLIAAGLDIDLAVLREATFQRIDFRFKSTTSRRRPRLTVSKTNTDDHADEIRFKIKDGSGPATEEHVFSRIRRNYVITPDGKRRSVGIPSVRFLRDKLKTIYRTTWLSLQRGADVVKDDDSDVEEEQISSVDRRLDQVLNQLVRYFSRLDRLVAEQTQEFQKRWFLSFLATERSLLQNSISKIDMLEERSALTAIFEKFNMTPESYEDQLEKHLGLASRVSESIRNKEAVQFRDYLVVFDVMRLHSLVEQWQDLQQKQKHIYSPKTDFISIASEMLFRKNISVNRSNQVVIQTDDSVPIPARKLSSGEKQLLIFLSETLLQEQEPFIFMADEPELSLHVEWQEELVPNLLKINPNAQVVFATHSPDVVNRFQNNVFKMEELTA